MCTVLINWKKYLCKKRVGMNLFIIFENMLIKENQLILILFNCQGWEAKKMEDLQQRITKQILLNREIGRDHVAQIKIYT